MGGGIAIESAEHPRFQLLFALCHLHSHALHTLPEAGWLQRFSL